MAHQTVAADHDAGDVKPLFVMDEARDRIANRREARFGQVEEDEASLLA